MNPNTRTLSQLLFKVFVRPFFPLFQGLVQSLGLYKQAITVEGPYDRQPYLIRMLERTETTESVVKKLRHAGFYDERVALTETGQIVSLRKLCEEVRGRQYHIRIFRDGEIRGHYELTPEDHPFGHWREEVFENRKEKFLAWL